MLVKLSIKNYVLIENLSISFDDGFSVITGETGTGKSVILAALNLLSGTRVDHKIVGPRFKKCIVEGEFQIKKDSFFDFFDYNDLDYEEITILRREILNNGKSRAFINDSPVKLETLKIFSEKLINIHTQNQSHILSNDDLFYDLLDIYANQLDKIKTYKNLLNDYNTINKQLDLLKIDRDNFLSNLEYNKFIFDEIDKMNLIEGEKTKLEEVFNDMRNFDKISSFLDEFKMFSSIQDETLNERVLKLSNTAKKISSYSNEFKSYSERFDKLNIEIDDLFISINNYMDNLSFDQNQFENTQSRLYKINELEKKHNVTSLSELIDKKNEIKKLLENSDYHNDKIKVLESKIELIKKRMFDISKKISLARKLSKSKIQIEMESAFKNLALKNSKIEFNLTESNEFNKNGINNIEVLYKPSKQSSPKILSKIASGGEKSRILFAIKSILSKKIDLPTLVFDEIDSGTSGEIANAIGKMMNIMGKKIQIISITHLPQVASLADHHFKVFKIDNEKNTTINIKKLKNSSRIEEIASMISGENITESAINQALELLK